MNRIMKLEQYNQQRKHSVDSKRGPKHDELRQIMRYTNSHMLTHENVLFAKKTAGS